MSHQKAFASAHERKHRDNTFSVFGMRPFQLRFVVIVLTLATLVCACGAPRDARFAPNELTVSGRVWPPDIVSSKGTTGVYAIDARTPATNLCCWIAPHARLAVRKRRPAKVLRINFYIPDTPLFRQHPQSVAVSLSGSRTRLTASGLRPGFHTISVKIPQAIQRSAVEQMITLDSAVKMPANGKQAWYGILLISIYFE
jgi:hypothetical protein